MLTTLHGIIGDNDEKDVKKKKKHSIKHLVFLIIIISFSWLLSEFWGTTIKLFLKEALGINLDSFIPTLVVTIVLTLIFVIMIRTTGTEHTIGDM